MVKYITNIPGKTIKSKTPAEKAKERYDEKKQKQEQEQEASIAKGLKGYDKYVSDGNKKRKIEKEQMRKRYLQQIADSDAYREQVNADFQTNASNKYFGNYDTESLRQQQEEIIYQQGLQQQQQPKASTTTNKKFQINFTQPKLTENFKQINPAFIGEHGSQNIDKYNTYNLITQNEEKDPMHMNSRDIIAQQNADRMQTDDIALYKDKWDIKGVGAPELLSNAFSHMEINENLGGKKTKRRKSKRRKSNKKRRNSRKRRHTKRRR